MSQEEREMIGGDLDLSPAGEICREHAGRKGDLLIVLQKIQSVYGYVPREVFPVVSGSLKATTSEIYGVLTFYNRFHLSRRGRHTIRACRGTACHFKGASEIIELIRRRFGLEEGRDTTLDGEFSLEEVACLGACGIAPVMTVDENTFGNLTPLEAVSAIKEQGSAAAAEPPSGSVDLKRDGSKGRGSKTDAHDGNSGI